MDKQCGGTREPCTGDGCNPTGGCVDPDDPNPYPGYNDDYYSYYFEFSDGSTLSGTSEDNIVTVNVGGFTFDLHVSCSDEFYGPDETPGTADDGYGEKDGPYQNLGHPAVTNYQIFKYKIDDKKDKCELDKQCGGNRANKYGGFNIHPNPTSSVLQVDMSTYLGLQGNIEIYDQIGNLVHTQQVNQIPDETIPIDMSKHPSGNYHVKVHIPDLQVILFNQFILARY